MSAERILVADDDELMGETVAASLEREGGFTVTVARDHPSACAHIHSHGTYPLVLTDWQRPGTNGLAGLTELLALNRPHPVALMSRAADRRAAEAALAAGAAGYLPKTMPAPSLIHAVHLMLAGEPYAPIAFLARPPAPPMPHATRLSPRETQVLDRLCRGLANKEIARELGLAEVTVKLHVRTLCRKLDAKNRTHAAMIARDALIV